MLSDTLVLIRLNACKQGQHEKASDVGANLYHQHWHDADRVPQGALRTDVPRSVERLHQRIQTKSNRIIASEFFVSVGTVKTHVNNLYRKLDARSRTQAVARGRELNLI